jgi:sporulation protein YlmC with PRC-barrel domain
MQFKQGTRIYSADGQELGHVDRVVLDPDTKEVTHIVIRQGFLFTEDKVLPIDLIDHTSADEIRISKRADELHLPQFEEMHYLSADELEDYDPEQTHPAEYATPLLWYPPVGTAWWGYPTYEGLSPAAVATPAVLERNIPKNSRGLGDGTRDASGHLRRYAVQDAQARADLVGKDHWRG